MDQDTFNMALRKFLKEVGVTSQREIEKKVADALSAGRLHGTEKLKVTMTLEIEAIGLSHVVNGSIELA